MAVIVIDEETDERGLADRLLRSNASEASRTAAVRALRDANPGLDLAAVRPGTVVVVPDLHAGLRRPPGSVEDGLDAATERVDAQLTGLVEVVRRGRELAEAASADAAMAVADEEVRHAAERDEVVGAVVERLASNVERAEDRAAKADEALTAALTAWSEDLGELRGLWSPGG